jgi:hypothetical protein
MLSFVKLGKESRKERKMKILVSIALKFELILVIDRKIILLKNKRTFETF